jgi:hypothetical protein
VLAGTVEDLVPGLLGCDECPPDGIGGCVGLGETLLEHGGAVLVCPERRNEARHHGIDLGRVVTIPFDASESVRVGG